MFPCSRISPRRFYGFISAMEQVQISCPAVLGGKVLVIDEMHTPNQIVERSEL